MKRTVSTRTKAIKKLSTSAILLLRALSRVALLRTGAFGGAFLAFLALLSVSIQLHGQVAVAPLQLVRQQFLSGTGIPVANGCVNFFATGTSTPQAIYADSTGTFQLSNPLQLDAAGEASVWMTNTGYDIVLNAGVPNTLCSVSVGSQLWRENNKNPFSIINGGSNYIVASGTIDPSGVAGMLAYRTDIPCFRGFTTLWDCLVRLGDVQTLTNKTLTTPTINTPTITNPNITGGGSWVGSPSLTNPTLGSPSVALNTPITVTYVNDTVAGTTTNFLVMFNPVTPNTVKTWCGSGCGNPPNAGAIGICVSNCSTSGNAQVAIFGQVSCAFDGSTTVNDYVAISQTASGKCTDAGATYPTSGQVIGRSLSTNGGVGIYPVAVYAQPEVRPTGTVAFANLATQAANISSTPMFTPAVNGFFRFSCYIVITQAATTSSTLPSCQVSYTDADSSTPETLTSTIISTANTVGQVGNQTSAYLYLYDKSGVAISYSTTGYVTSGATPMQYAIHIRLEGPF